MFADFLLICKAYLNMSDINVELNDYATTNTCLGKVASTGKFADKHPMGILVGVDNPFNKMFIDKLFQKFGYTESHRAENGIEVLKKLDHEEIDLILMDIQMPEMDGMQATQRIIEKYGDDRL